MIGVFAIILNQTSVIKIQGCQGSALWAVIQNGRVDPARNERRHRNMPAGWTGRIKLFLKNSIIDVQEIFIS